MRSRRFLDFVATNGLQRAEVVLAVYPAHVRSRLLARRRPLRRLAPRAVIRLPIPTPCRIVDLYALSRLREVMLQFSSFSTRPRPIAPIRARSAGSSMRRATALAKAISSLGGAYTAASAAEDLSLLQVEGDDGLPERHVLHHLDPRRHIVERARRIGIEADVCRREIPHHVRIGDESGEEDVILETEGDGLRLELLERVAVPNQHAVEIGATEIVKQVPERTQQIVDAILRVHRANDSRRSSGPCFAAGRRARRASPASGRGRSGR